MEFSLDSVKKGFQAFVEGLPTWAWKQVVTLNKLLGGMPDPVVEKELLEAENQLKQIETQYQLDKDIVARFTRDLLQNITINALPLGTSVITRAANTGLVTMALINILDNYPEYRRRYNEDFVKTWGNLLIDTAIEAGTEKIPLENLIKLAGTGGWRDFVKYMASEVFQENAAEMLHIAHEAAQGIHHSFDQVLERLAYTTALTTVSSPVLGGLGYTVGRVYKNRDPISVEPEKFEPFYIDKELPNFNYRLTTGEDGTPVFNAQKFYDYVRSQGELKVLPEQKIRHIIKLLDPTERKTEAEKILYSELEQELNEDIEKFYQEGLQYKKWYDKAKEWLEQHSKDFKYLDFDRLAAIYAITSQRSSIPTNTARAETLAREIEEYIEKAGGDIETGVDLWYEEASKRATSKAGKTWFRKLAESVKDPYNIMNFGLKISNYWRNLRGHKDKPTIDLWMWRLFGLDPNKESVSYGQGLYQLVQNYIEKKAAEKGLNPDEYQAIVWMGIKKLWNDKMDPLDFEYSSHVVKQHLGFKIDTTLSQQDLYNEISKLIDKHGLNDQVSAVFVEKHPLTGEYYVFIKPLSSKMNKEAFSKFVDDVVTKFNVVGASQHVTDKVKKIQHSRLSKTANMFYVYNFDTKAPIDKIADELRRYDLRVIPTPAGSLLITTKKKNIDPVVVKSVLEKYLPEGFKIYTWKQLTDGNFLRFDIDPYTGQWDPEYWEAVQEMLQDENTIVFKPFKIEGVKAKIFEDMPLQFSGGGIKQFPDYTNQQDLINIAYSDGKFTRAVLPNNATVSDLIAAMLSAEEVVVPNNVAEKALKAGYIDKDEISEQTYHYTVLTPKTPDDLKIALRLHGFQITPREFREKFEVLRLQENEEKLAEILDEYWNIAKEFGFASVVIPEPAWFWDGDMVTVVKPEVLRKALERFAKNLGIPKTAVGLGGTLNLSIYSGNSDLLTDRSAAVQTVVGEHYPEQEITEPPISQIIQLNRGRGSFAHEWFHALDSYFLAPVLDLQGQTRTASEFIDQIPEGEVESPDEMFYTGQVRPEVIKAFKDLLDYVSRPEFTEKIKNEVSRIYGEEAADYFLRPTEMLARAFEFWYYNKFKDDFILANPIHYESENEVYPWDPKELDKLFTKLFKTLKTQDKTLIPDGAIVSAFLGNRLMGKAEFEPRLVTYFYKPKHQMLLNASIDMSLENINKISQEIDEFRKKFGVRVKVETVDEKRLPDLTKWIEALVFFEKKTGIPIKYLAPVVTFTDKNPNWYGQTHELEIKISDGSPFIHELLHFLFNKGDVYTGQDFITEASYNVANTQLIKDFIKSSYFRRLVNYELAGRRFPMEEALAYAFEDWFARKYGEHPLIVNREEIPEKFKLLDSEYAELDKVFTEYLKRIKEAAEHEYNKTKGVIGYLQGVEAIKKPDWSDKIYAWWIRSILSAPSTHLVNIASNFANLHAAALTKAIEEGRLKAWWEFEKTIWQNLFTLGKSLQDTVAFFAKLDEPSKLEGQSQYYQFGNILDLPVQALQWEDAFFKSLIYNGFLAAEADRHIEKGINPYDPENEKYLYEAWEKLKDDEDRRFLFVKHPPEKIQQEAIHWAREFTFTDENELAQKIIEFRDKVPGLRYLIPFVKTPTNIIKQTIEMSPAGIILGLINQNKHLTAKGLAGSIMMAMAALALTNCEEEETNLVCEYLKRLEPFGTLAQLMTEPEKAIEKLNDVVFFNQAIQNLYYLFIKGDVLKPLKNIAGGFVPNFLYRLALIEDPVMRIKTDPLEAVINKIPVARKTLRPYYNQVGEQVGLKEATPLTILLTPRLDYDIYGDPVVEKTFKELGIKAYPLKLFSEEEIRVTRRYGEYLRRLVRDERFRKMMKSQQKTIILSLIKNRNRAIRRLRERWKVYTGK